MIGVHEKIVSASELVSLTLPEPRWAVPGLFPEGLNLLAGKPKIGKSWLALLIALAVANGGTLFGKTKVESGEVLYLALEDNRRRLQDRLKKVLGKEPAPDSLHLVTEWPRLKSGGLESIESYLREHPRCRLVLIDTLSRIRPERIRGADPYEEDGTLGKMLQALAHKYHIAVVAVHHTRKAKAADILDTVLGSTGLTGAADSIAVLTRKRGMLEALLTITGRDIDEQEIKLSFDETTCEWEVSEAEWGPVLSRQRKAILDLLGKARKALTPKEIAEACSLPHGSVKHLVRRLDDEGLIVRQDDGRYIVEGKSPV